MVKVNVKDGNIEKALKKLKGKVRNTKQNVILRDNKEYTKPSASRRQQKKNAIYLEKKRRESDDI